ncbi:torsin-1A-interacting protein 2-like isoform X1 [Lates japonicus]|uniref:Torsin-1A-interacting protein 2-like isoform X1 n=1 Tax=Lates japonicus TaxID=270547 RepID=A0AAD3MAA1_LATJO|nr:torsin-1A-interacting protein 2-like isoform X1 [Lates japonicus]
MSEVPLYKDMADQNTASSTPQHTPASETGNSKDKIQSRNMDHDLPSDQNVQLPHSEASSSASTNTEAEINTGEKMEQDDVNNDGSTDEKSTTSPQADDGGQGDYSKEQPKNEELCKTALIHSETTEVPTLGDREDDQVNESVDGQGNGSRAGAEESSKVKDTNSEAGGGEEEDLTPPTLGEITHDQVDGPEARVEESSDITDTDREARADRDENIENIGPMAQENIEPPVRPLEGLKYVIVGVVVVAILMKLLQPEPPPQKNNLQHIDVFLRQMKKVEAQFPNQRAELWNRSRIHLQRHLQTAQPTEPVSLILTAGLSAERTLHCLAQGMASAFSSALNASVLHIDGASKANQDSDQVKLDIDNKLQGAFEGDKPVAVIHRFEELPPGSTLIFYRYCDHENAAYKKTFLIFTVLLGEEEEIPAKIRLSAVEEMVDDHLQRKFLSHGHPVSFDRMDLDKYGGLWSRISHLILPVAAVEKMENEGCEGT